MLNKISVFLRSLFTHKLFRFISFTFCMCSFMTSLYAATDSHNVRELRNLRPSQYFHGYVLFVSQNLSFSNKEHGYDKETVDIPVSCEPGYSACAIPTLFSTNSTDENGGNTAGCLFRELHMESTIDYNGSGYRVTMLVGVRTRSACDNRGGKGYFTVMCVPQANVAAGAITQKYCLTGLSA